MIKTIIIVFSILINCTLKAQFLTQAAQDPLLKSIAVRLINLRDYQSDCDLSRSLQYDRSMRSVATITTKKVPTDTLCGFYYHFKTHDNFRKNALDFTSFYGSTHYLSINGSVSKTSFSEKPDRFRGIFIKNLYVPAIQCSSAFYYVTPYQIGELINKTIKDYNTKIIQSPDTIINKENCLRFILSTNKNQVTTKIELCFHKKELYPIYYRKDIMLTKGSQYTIAIFSNSKVNFELPKDFFSENNLLGKNWKVNNPEFPTNNSIKVGESAPDWNLPVLGKEGTLSSKSLRGKYILMEFTATWCGHCVEAVKAMNSFEDRFANNKGITIVSIFSSEIDKKEQVQSFIKQHHGKSTILYSAKDVGENYHVSGYPIFFIISPEGKIFKNYLGYSKDVETEIINDINELIK